MYENEGIEFDELGALLIKCKELFEESREAIQTIQDARDPDSPEGKQFSPEERIDAARQIKEAGQAFINLGDSVLEALED